MDQRAERDHTAVADPDPAVANYLRLASRSSPLSERRQIRLWRRYRAGEADAFDALVAASRITVADLARRYESSRLGFMDLAAEGCVAVIRALHAYDPGRDGALSTFVPSCAQRAVATAAGEAARWELAPAARRRPI